MGDYGPLPCGRFDGLFIGLLRSDRNLLDPDRCLSLQGRIVVRFPGPNPTGLHRPLILCQVPSLGWLYWVPTLGTFALVLFGYCLMARILSLLPGNRAELMSLDLIRRTFLTLPVPGDVHHGLPEAGCPGGVCVIEPRIATLSARTGAENQD
jgi:hypothetical protein